MEATIENVKVLVKKDSRKVLAAMGKLTRDNTRYSFSDVRITTRGVAVACDGRRLAAVHLGTGFKSQVVNIPGKLAGKVEALELAGDEATAHTADGEVKLSKPENAYPPLADTVPFKGEDEVAAVITVNVKLLAGLMEAVAAGGECVTLVVGSSRAPLVVLDSGRVGVSGGGLLCPVYPDVDASKPDWQAELITRASDRVEQFRQMLQDVDASQSPAA